MSSVLLVRPHRAHRSAGVAAVSSCSEMRPCTTDAGATDICANGVCVDRIGPETRHGLTFVITTKYPVATLQVGINLVRRYIGWQQECFETRKELLNSRWLVLFF